MEEDNWGRSLKIVLAGPHNWWLKTNCLDEGRVLPFDLTNKDVSERFLSSQVKDPFPFKPDWADTARKQNGDGRKK